MYLFLLLIKPHTSRPFNRMGLIFLSKRSNWHFTESWNILPIIGSSNMTFNALSAKCLFSLKFLKFPVSVKQFLNSYIAILSQCQCHCKKIGDFFGKRPNQNAMDLVLSTFTLKFKALQYSWKALGWDCRSCTVSGNNTVSSAYNITQNIDIFLILCPYLLL